MGCPFERLWAELHATPHPAPHPSDDCLIAYCCAGLDSDAISRHLLHCEVCIRRLEQIDLRATRR